MLVLKWCPLPITRLEERKVVGRKTRRRFFCTACSHLARFSMSHPNVRCVDVGLAWVSGEQAMSEGKSGPVETGLTGPVATALYYKLQKHKFNAKLLG